MAEPLHPVRGARDYTIRPAVAADKPAIMRILRDTPEFLPAEVVVAEEVLDCYIGDVWGSGYYVLVAETGSGLAGYVCYGPTPMTESTWDIYWIATARAERNRGIGKALMARAEEGIADGGGRLILVETSSKPDYEGTRRFYHSRAYEIISRIPDFYAPGDDRLTFSKRVGAAGAAAR